MTALEGSTAFATIVGLIFNWMQVRDAAAEDQFQAFLLWLDNHHFQDLRSKIMANGDLQRELNQLLREDTKSLSSKLDVLCFGVSALACRIEHLANIAQSLNASREALSDQAVQVVKCFEELQASQMLVEATEPDAFQHICFLPAGTGFKVIEPRFLKDDVRSLCKFGYLHDSAEFSSDGISAYTLSRAGAAFAKHLPTQTPLLTEAQEIEMVSGGGSY